MCLFSFASLVLDRLLQAQQDKKQLEEKLLVVKKQADETDSNPFTEVRCFYNKHCKMTSVAIFHSMTKTFLQMLHRCQDDLKKAQSDLDRQKAEMVKKEEEIKSVTRANEEREKKLQMEIDRLKDQSKKEVCGWNNDNEYSFL